jgi:hypothetical protein
MKFMVNGHDIEKFHSCTLGMNEKGEMNTVEFEAYMQNSTITLYPDAADVPGWCDGVCLDPGLITPFLEALRVFFNLFLLTGEARIKKSNYNC